MSMGGLARTICRASDRGTSATRASFRASLTGCLPRPARRRAYGPASDSDPKGSPHERCSGPARRPRAGPLPRHELSVPAQQRLGTHEEDVPARARQDPAERRQEGPVARAVHRPLDLATKDRESMTKHDDFEVGNAFVALGVPDQAQQPAEHEITGGRGTWPGILPPRALGEKGPARSVTWFMY